GEARARPREVLDVLFAGDDQRIEAPLLHQRARPRVAPVHLLAGKQGVLGGIEHDGLPPRPGCRSLEPRPCPPGRDAAAAERRCPGPGPTPPAHRPRTPRSARRHAASAYAPPGWATQAARSTRTPGP